MKCSLRKLCVKARFVLTIFKILLFKGWLELSTVQQSTVSERVKVSAKNRKKYSDFVEIS